MDIKNSSEKAKYYTSSFFFLMQDVVSKFYTDVHIKTFETNYFGAIKWIEEWLPKHELCTTTFVSMSSLITVHSTLRFSAYCASKSELKSYIKSLRLQ